MPIKIGFIHGVIRPEEKYLIREFESRPGVEVNPIDIRKISLNLSEINFDHTLFFDRCISHEKGNYLIQILEAAGHLCINTARISTICGNKLLTCIELQKRGIPQVPTMVAFSQEEALQAMESLGFPVVLKPLVGSWGRLLAKINDREAAEAILEHKVVLGSYNHSVFYIQKYVKKKGRDIRAVVIDDECIAAIYRISDHWITNTARGAQVAKCPVTPELHDIAVQAATAIGRGIIAVDLFETDNGYLVNELNSTMEFRNSIHTTGVNIPARIADFVLKIAREKGNGYGES